MVKTISWSCFIYDDDVDDNTAQWVRERDMYFYISNEQHKKERWTPTQFQISFFFFYYFIFFLIFFYFILFSFSCAQLYASSIHHTNTDNVSRRWCTSTRKKKENFLVVVLYFVCYFEIQVSKKGIVALDKVVLT